MSRCASVLASSWSPHGTSPASATLSRLCNVPRNWLASTTVTCRSQWRLSHRGAWMIGQHDVQCHGCPPLEYEQQQVHVIPFQKGQGSCILGTHMDVPSLRKRRAHRAQWHAAHGPACERRRVPCLSQIKSDKQRGSSDRHAQPGNSSKPVPTDPPPWDVRCRRGDQNEGNRRYPKPPFTFNRTHDSAATACVSAPSCPTWRRRQGRRR